MNESFRAEPYISERGISGSNVRFDLILVVANATNGPFPCLNVSLVCVEGDIFRPSPVKSVTKEFRVLEMSLADVSMESISQWEKKKESLRAVGSSSYFKEF